MASLELGVIGNCVLSALVDSRGGIVWSCYPRLDGDPVFHSLIDTPAQGENERGVWKVELEGCSEARQHYVHNTAVLVTRLATADGAAIEITDFCPRFESRGRIFRPQMLVRRLRPLSGAPRIKVVLQPSFEYGERQPEITHGSNHICFVGRSQVLRLTTDAPLSYIIGGTPFMLDEEMSFLLGPDETLQEGVSETACEFQDQTEAHWKQWVRRLALPLEWQDAVIRAAITLKLCTFEETGAIVAAMTTSIPEAERKPGDAPRNWDYRYCWLRDAFFVVRALNSLSEVETMENYLRWIANVASASPSGHLQPVYGIAQERTLFEREITQLKGYRGMGPVRAGNQAYEHFQHDVYGNVVLASAQAFFDKRLMRPFGVAEFERLERIGEQAYRVYATPDAGMWELRTRARVHTSSAVMSWAACDRLAKIATHLEREERARLWHERAMEIRNAIEERAWNESLGSYVESFGGDDVEAGLLLMTEIGFLPPSHPRFVSTVNYIGKRLGLGHHLRRYAAADDFGVPTTAFLLCSFWQVDALARLGKRQQAREAFNHILERRNKVGLLSEGMHPETGELWGNYPQTYSQVGIINAAVRLSEPWERVI